MRQETVAMDEQVETELRLSHAASAMDAELFRKMSLRGDSIHGTPIQVTPRPLSSDGLAAAAGVLGVPAPVLWTVVAVETSGCGFLPDRRPQILFERHVFHRLTHGKFDDGEISSPVPGGYGAGGAHQYERLAAAAAKDCAAALESASWGIGQIMGENYSMAGYPNVEEMVAAMMESEDQQLLAMSRFLAHRKLQEPLKAHDWARFARDYNGPDYAVHRYDLRLQEEFRKYAAGRLPDLNTRAVQLYLTFLGWHPGAIDGVAGESTQAALAQFQKQQGLPATSATDPAALGPLTAAQG